MRAIVPAEMYFNPRPPRGGRRSFKRDCRVFLKFQSTPSARRATLRLADIFVRFIISIHALREEGDVRGHRLLRCRSDFNPRPPRGGRLHIITHFYRFVKNFNPRPPRGGRPLYDAEGPSRRHFNPRPPRGGRRMMFSPTRPLHKFQSTPSARRATAAPSSPRFQ